MTSKQGKRLNPFQHALQRPDTYIGSIKTVTREMWVYEEPVVNEEIDEEGASPSPPVGSFVLKPIKYNQGLTRIFVEIMSNAIDNKWRSEKHGISMKKIDFTLDQDPDSETYGWITVTNDGYGIPVEKAQYDYEDFRNNKVITEELYPAEVFFGEMLAGTNFEEDESRKTSGRNGMGAKAGLIFSTEFNVDHANIDQQKRFVQIYRNNGKERDQPEITSYRAKTNYTKISMLPDYERFDYPGMDEDLYALFKRYIYEAAMITGLTVSLNGEKIIVKDLAKFAKLFYPDAKENHMIHIKAPNGDECVLVEKGIPDVDAAEDVSHLSWINGINTRDGGVHVDAWKEAIFHLFVRTFNSRKPNKGEKEALKTSAKETYPYFVLFVRAEAANARFDSQTKDRLTDPNIVLAEDKEAKKSFGVTLADAVKKMMKWNFVSLLEEKLVMRSERSLAKKEGVKRKIKDGKNIQNANFAGTADAHKCTLFITEGLSAKAFADRLISSIENGTDYYGSFAIRGKFINAQRFPVKVVNANEEVQQLKGILGLMVGEVYTDLNDLRYGHVCFMTDQDDDGLHIRGLLLNFFWHFWPSLFDLQSEDGTPYLMFESFTTMVTMAKWGGAKGPMKMFYSNPEFHDWFEKEGTSIKGLKIKYYKGLGTHVPGDEMLYLEDQKKLQYTLDGEESEYMTLGFADKQSDWRKLWITRDMVKPGEMSLVEPELIPMIIDGEISLSTFVDQQLSIYHRMVLRRALPGLFDGFKEAQRKIFYGVMMDPDARKAPMVVEVLAGAVKKIAGYHHGALSLENTMIGMAQGFVGSNNIPLLVNGGEMGTRLEGGQDAAAARYPETCLEDIAWVLFSQMDWPLLERMEENGIKVEPRTFMPCLPMVLINGPRGIASGYSTDIPNYNPIEIADRVEAWLDSEDGMIDLPPLVPWYRGFTGSIELLTRKGKTTPYEIWDPETAEGKPTSWRSKGVLEQGKSGWWHIKEIPVGVWTNRVKEHLSYLETGDKPEGKKTKKKAEEKKRYLLDVRWKGSPNTAVWDIKPTKDFIPDMDVVGNLKILQSVSPLTNIHVIDENDYPRKYSSPEDLLYDFCPRRLEMYDRRREYWLEEYGKDHAKESYRYIYVKSVVDKKLNMHQEDAKLEADMLKLGLKKMPGGKENKDGEIIETFDYLLSMQMRSMTVRKLEEIKKEVDRIKAKIDELEAKSGKDLWKEDLAAVRVAYEKFLKTRKEEVDSKRKIKMK